MSEIFRFSTFHRVVGLCLTVCLTTLFAETVAAEGKPTSILAKRIGGHIHPSICKTKAGTLLVVFKGDNVLLRSRSEDGGITWDEPLPIQTSAKRPDVIREVTKFEIYPGTVDTLPDGRIVTTWNYIADDKANDGYYERALLYSISKDDGLTWSDQQLIGPVEGKHLGAVRHNVLPWNGGQWLLPLRTGPPRLFDPASGKLEIFPVATVGGKQHEFQQIIRSAKSTLLAMGPELLRSTDNGATWTAVAGFPVSPPDRDNLEGRFITALSNGGVVVTWGVGSDNTGLRFAYSANDGLTWNQEPVTLLPETKIAARYYSARTIQLDGDHVGSVYMNSAGVHFLRVPIERLAE